MFLYLANHDLKSINIIGCGPTANQWPGNGESLGVNDCEKIGKPVDKLLIIDWPLKFNPDRFEIIHKSKAIFYSQLSAWQRYKEVNLIAINRWRGRLELGKVNFSNTSTFVAICLAYSWGYQEITLWGVDFNDNRTYWNEERLRYKELFAELATEGIMVWLGCKGSALDLEVKTIMIDA